MQYPFETTTKDGRKATVLGAIPDGRLIGYLTLTGNTFTPWDWEADGSSYYDPASITLPLQIKPLTTYRMRNGGIAWTSGLVGDGQMHGVDASGRHWTWHVIDGRWSNKGDAGIDLIEELPPGTTA